VDETLLTIGRGNYRYWLWLACKLNLQVCLLFHYQKRLFFFELPVFQTNKNKIWKLAYLSLLMMFNDSEPMQVRMVRFEHIIYETDLENIMERFIQHIKYRIEYFDDSSPCKIKRCSRQHVDSRL